MTMEFSFLYAIPRTAVLDGFFLAVTKIAGSYGQLWVIVAAVLLIFNRQGKRASRCCWRIGSPGVYGKYTSPKRETED